MNDSKKYTGLRIDKIVIERLFGIFDYEINIPDRSIENGVSLTLLYGDNGSGKTTILSLLHHLLSSESRRGHRTFLANTRFKKYEVIFNNGFSLSASRERDMKGPYQITLSRQRQPSIIVHVGASRRRGITVTSSDLDEDLLDRLFKTLFSRKFSSFYLSDEREFDSDRFKDDPLYYSSRPVPARWNDSEYGYVDVDEDDIEPEPDQLTYSLRRVETWLRSQAINASRRSDRSTANIYSQIVQRLSDPQQGSHPLPENRDSLINIIRKLDIENHPLQKFGLASPTPSNRLVETISGASEEAIPTIAQVLAPYIESIGARNEQLYKISKRLELFLSILNKFYVRKSVDLHIQHGITIKGDNGDLLPASALSSGERQLLMLLCNVLVSTDLPSIFIIDEPELSLNVKWQRELLESLILIASETDVQFILATHSIEILSQHQSSVVKLDSAR